MKINILMYHLDQGGVEKTAVELANELVHSGHDVTITTLYKHKPHLFRINSGIKLKSIFGFYIKGMDSVVSLIPKKILRSITIKGKFDIEIAFQADLPTALVGCRGKENIAKYAWIHGVGFENLNDYTNFDKVFFVGEDLKKHYIEHDSRYNHSKFEVFYNSIDIDEIVCLSADNNPEEVINAGDHINFVSVGRLSQEKRFDRLIEAFNKTLVVAPNISLSIIGEGNKRNQIEELIERYDLGEKVTLLGFKSNPYPYIKRADVYVCSSDYEGFNVAMTEAAILETPIVSTRVNGAKEFIGNSSFNGLLTESNSDSISNSMIKLLDYRLREKLSNNAKIKIAEIIEERRDTYDKYFRGKHEKK